MAQYQIILGVEHEEIPVPMRDPVSMPITIGQAEDSSIVILSDERKYGVIAKNGTMESSILVLHGLVDSVIFAPMASNFVLHTSSPCLSFGRSLSASPSEYSMAITQAAMKELQKLHVADRLGISMRASGSCSIILDASAKQNCAQLSTNATALTIVRLCVVSDWSNYNMIDMQNMLVKDMIYTEVV